MDSLTVEQQDLIKSLERSRQEILARRASGQTCPNDERNLGSIEARIDGMKSGAKALKQGGR